MQRIGRWIPQRDLEQHDAKRTDRHVKYHVQIRVDESIAATPQLLKRRQRYPHRIPPRLIQRHILWGPVRIVAVVSDLWVHSLSPPGRVVTQIKGQPN